MAVDGFSDSTLPFTLSSILPKTTNLHGESKHPIAQPLQRMGNLIRALGRAMNEHATV